MAAPHQTSQLRRDIGSEDLKIEGLIKQLREDKFLVPTFQRDFVWQPANIAKLWDSIYKFYPIGSLLYWETNSYLHTHRRLGGFEFPHDEDTVRKFKEWKYILDGQQRATALLVSFVGGRGRVEDNEDFDYTIYFDATKSEFFFHEELEERRKRTPTEFLIRVRDVPDWNMSFYRKISGVKGFTSDVEDTLQRLQRMFTDYKLSVIRITGVEVGEVCDIFERINQEGKKLDPVDIIVARTYRNEDEVNDKPGFYLRDNLNGLKKILRTKGNNRFQDLDDLAIIQMVALCLRKKHTGERNPYGITPRALNNITTEDFEDNWVSCQKTIFETIKFLGDQKIQGPGMVPFAYLALPLCYYFHENKRPNRDIARQWFWRNAFGLEAFRTGGEVTEWCDDFFDPLEGGKEVRIPPLTISKRRLIEASYNYRNSLSRAVLAFLAKQGPVDFSDPDAEVLDNTYLLLSQSPNLHHIYPLNFLEGIKRLASDPNSLMNICYLRAHTNIKIGDKNPLIYFRQFKRLKPILKSHLIPRTFVQRTSFAPEDYAEFLSTRADWLARRLKAELPDVQFQLND